MKGDCGFRFHRRCPRWVKQGLLGLVLVVLFVRSLPYLVPIRGVDLAQTDQAVEFRDRHGLFLGTLLTRDQEHTAVVSLDHISPLFLHAIIAAEDQRFYRHGALDLRAIGRAFLEAVQARKIVSGASTITMQLARMVAPSPPTLWGKLEEIWHAWRLTAGMNKSDILSAYVNRLPMGGNIYGVEAASQVYFGIPARDLNLAQASLLAALPNDPTDLNPYSRWNDLKERQRYVLDRMVVDEYITDTQAHWAYAEDVLLQPPTQGIVAAPHFLFWLADQLPNAHPAVIHTTLDRPLQQFVEAQVQQVVRSLATHHGHHAAALVIDNANGDVLAYVGSPDYFADNQGSNDGVQALRQPGSALKPFLYQLALEHRLIRPNTILADVPTHYALPGARLYSPVDYSDRFRGPVRVRVALANSLNVPAVRVLERVGVASFLDRLHQLGFTHLDQSADYYGLGLALGSGEVSLWELARAYYALAQQGRVQELQTQVNASVPASLSSLALLSADGSWALITDMLSDRYARAAEFGVDSILSLPFPAAVKTGTSSDYRDTWTVGYTTDYTVATWVGNFDGSPMQEVSGVTGAAPLWARLMVHLHEHQTPQAFPQPPGMVQRPICALSGLRPSPQPSQACSGVVQEYFYSQDLAEYDRQVDPADGTAHADASLGAADRIDLPEDYNSWLATQSNSGSDLRIASPQEGDYFLMADPHTSPVPQRLEWRLVGQPSQPVEWWLNGERITTQSDRSFFWMMQPGTWTLEVRKGNERDRVQFQVGLAEPRSLPRGFSVAE